ncbi:SUKH-3 domain-containing protein [Streptomyces sp. NRRL S-646]|uniref:SUKH-3 domain-containing protein n=1 Tax=Streptomyces sp. NRRL S-646 TaxID=1463917 RepID=UPI003B63E18B
MKTAEKTSLTSHGGVRKPPDYRYALAGVPGLAWGKYVGGGVRRSPSVGSAAVVNQKRLSVGIVMHDAAEAFLQEFGGLTVSIGGPGINRAREPFELNPELAWGDVSSRSASWMAAVSL